MWWGCPHVGQRENVGVLSVGYGEPLGAGVEQKTDMMGEHVNSYHSGCCVQNRLKGH